MKFRRISIVLGYFFIILGALLILDGLTLTGFSIFDNLEGKRGIYEGVISILVGLGILLLKDYATQDLEERFTNPHHYHKTHHSFKGSRGLRDHNREAHDFAKMNYSFEHGRKPTKEELRRYTRHLHETGELHTILEDKHHRKSA